MECVVLMAGTVMASSLGVALPVRVVRTIKGSATTTGSLPACPLAVDEKAEDCEPLIGVVPVIRGYDTPELCREDRLAKLERSMGDKRPS